MNPLAQFRRLDTFVFDVDGVMTDSNVLVLEDGKLLRRMSIRDGYALKLAVQRGLRIAIITGGKSEGVVTRLRNLGVQDIYAGVANKLDALEELTDIYNLDLNRVLYMGDDLPDFEVMRKVGLPACPRNAAHEILEIARYVSPYDGGQGCVRDVLEKTLRLQNKWLPEPVRQWEADWEKRVNKQYFGSEEEQPYRE